MENTKPLNPNQQSVQSGAQFSPFPNNTNPATSATSMPESDSAPVQEVPTPDADQAIPAAPVTPNDTMAATTTVSTDSDTARNNVKVGAKVLIVEDEPDARTIFVDLLESEKYEVSSAVDGNDALAKAAADKFDLILLDLVMPNKDGLETLQDLKSDPEKYGTPIIVVLTNISGDAAVEKAMALGAAGYRLKVEAEPDQLLKDVNDFLHGKKQDVTVEKVGRSLI